MVSLTSLSILRLQYALLYPNTHSEKSEEKEENPDEEMSPMLAPSLSLPSTPASLSPYAISHQNAYYPYFIVNPWLWKYQLPANVAQNNDLQSNQPVYDLMEDVISGDKISAGQLSPTNPLPNPIYSFPLTYPSFPTYPLLYPQYQNHPFYFYHPTQEDITQYLPTIG